MNIILDKENKMVVQDYGFDPGWIEYNVDVVLSAY